MAEIERTWPKESLAAVSIDARDCEIDIQGIEGDQVELKGDFSGHRERDLKIDDSGQYLKLHAERAQIKLKLPKDKAWSISIFSGRGDVKVRDIQARVRIMMGRGDIQIERYHGIAVIGAGRGNLKIKDFVQQDIEVPECVASLPDHLSGNEANSAWNWFYGWKSDREEWGRDLGEKIGWWALDPGRFFENVKFPEKDTGLNLQMGDGNIEIEDIEASVLIMKLGRGNLKMKDIRVSSMAANLTCGDMDGKSIIPAGDWTIKTTKGNVRFSLPSNIGVRLDMATRYGNIESEIPLVRVARQGPESFTGMRMVGFTGPGESDIPQLQITAGHGNIKIESGPPIHTFFARPVTPEEQSSQTRVNQASELQSPQEPVVQPPACNTPLAILQALQEGRISMAEADQLLRSLEI
jgi:hypothetical protein